MVIVKRNDLRDTVCRPYTQNSDLDVQIIVYYKSIDGGASLLDSIQYLLGM